MRCYGIFSWGTTKTLCFYWANKMVQSFDIVSGVQGFHLVLINLSLGQCPITKSEASQQPACTGKHVVHHNHLLSRTSIYPLPLTNKIDLLLDGAIPLLHADKKTCDQLKTPNAHKFNNRTDDTTAATGCVVSDTSARCMNRYRCCFQLYLCVRKTTPVIHLTC